ncbi:hypothetical protein Alsa1_CDS0157 [Staphylococcus phage Alsa_1]|nr:hypothetical protein Alsa1_CDS0157 [Staphylococcus phage Alsa_1]
MHPFYGLKITGYSITLFTSKRKPDRPTQTDHQHRPRQPDKDQHKQNDRKSHLEPI